MAAKTCGSACNAFIAALSLARLWNAEALCPMRASLAAFEAASRNALALCEKLLNAEPFARMTCNAWGWPDSARNAFQCPLIACKAFGCDESRLKAAGLAEIADRDAFEIPASSSERAAADAFLTASRNSFC